MGEGTAAGCVGGRHREVSVPTPARVRRSVEKITNGLGNRQQFGMVPKRQRVLCYCCVAYEWCRNNDKTQRRYVTKVGRLDVFFISRQLRIPRLHVYLLITTTQQQPGTSSAHLRKGSTLFASGGRSRSVGVRIQQHSIRDRWRVQKPSFRT